MVADQKSVLADRRDDACQKLRDGRDMAYRDLLDHQNDTRLIFRERLAAGLDNAPFFQQLRDGLSPPAEATSSFQDAAGPTTNRTTAGETSQAPGGHEDASHSDRTENGSHDGGGGIGLSLRLGMFSIGESLFGGERGERSARRHPGG